MTANKDAFAMAEPIREAAGMLSITCRDGSWYFRAQLAHATVCTPWLQRRNASVFAMNSFAASDDFLLRRTPLSVEPLKKHHANSIKFPTHIQSMIFCVNLPCFSRKHAVTKCLTASTFSSATWLVFVFMKCTIRPPTCCQTDFGYSNVYSILTSLRFADVNKASMKSRWTFVGGRNCKLDVWLIDDNTCMGCSNAGKLFKTPVVVQSITTASYLNVPSEEVVWYILHEKSLRNVSFVGNWSNFRYIVNAPFAIRRWRYGGASIITSWMLGSCAFRFHEENDLRKVIPAQQTSNLNESSNSLVKALYRDPRTNPSVKPSYRTMSPHMHALSSTSMRIRSCIKVCKCMGRVTILIDESKNQIRLHFAHQNNESLPRRKEPTAPAPRGA